MPLTKATQNVILDNICTTDTAQTITGVKTFSNQIIGNILGNADTANLADQATAITGGLNGDILYQSSSSVTSKLGIGSNNQILSSDGTIPVWTTGIIGETTGAVATVGYIGEIQSSVSTAVAITTNATITVSTLTLQPGVWQLYGNAAFNFTGTTTTANQTIAISISTVAATLQADAVTMLLPVYTTATASPAFVLNATTNIVILTAPTIYYIVVKAPTFGAGSVTVSSAINGVRVR